jgi:hypothetical protein
VYVCLSVEHYILKNKLKSTVAVPCEEVGGLKRVLNKK